MLFERFRFRAMGSPCEIALYGDTRADLERGRDVACREIARLEHHVHLVAGIALAKQEGAAGIALDGLEDGPGLELSTRVKLPTASDDEDELLGTGRATYTFQLDLYKRIGAITPLGGLCLIAGWLTLAWFSRGRAIWKDQ